MPITAEQRFDTQIVEVVPVRRPAASSLWVLRAASLLLFFAVSVSLQLAAGAYTSELGTEFDDASHYVTGLMVHDYIVGGLHGDPVTFALNYYAHYPKIGIGHWPPVFYLIEALWMALFGTSIGSALLLMAMINALIGVLICETARTLWPSWLPGVIGGLFFICLPVVQRFSDTVMLDTAVALVVLAAAIAWGRYLERGSNLHAAYFAASTILAILTKGNGYALAFLPPISLLLCRRFELLKKRNLWVAALAVALFCLPWTFVTRHLVDSTLQYAWGLSYFKEASKFYWSQVACPAGLAAGWFAVAGLAMQIAAAVRGSISGMWASVVSLIPAIVLFHSVVPMSIDPRYVIAMLPSLVLLGLCAGYRLLALVTEA
jgi:4-amino-4-deoxy-L-arabinose transferase-like glycosyltransferase